MKQLALFSVAVLLISVCGAGAQVSLTFSGGSGAPLSITVNQPVTFAITTGVPAGRGPGFVFQNTGNIIPTSDSGGGTLTFRVNSGPSSAALNQAGTGTTSGSITANDLLMFNLAALPPLNLGDIVTLNAGTYFTSSIIAAAAPANGLYTSFIVDGNNDVRISTNAAPVPEPSSLAMTALGALGLIAYRRRRRAR